MTDIFSVLWGRKKRPSIDATATTDESFVSYIEKDLTDDFQDFVLIDTQRLYPRVPLYQTQFGYSAQLTGHSEQIAKSKMGIGSSTAVNGKSQEICSQTFIPESERPMTYENAAPNVTRGEDETYNVSSFLTDVPFELSSKLSSFQSLQSLKLDGYQYFNSKADMMENLSYNFELERAVLFETECAVTDFQI
uniref:UMA domain-containing protein n=1 Tax=Strigamia maritima TaxID=126957 RepID=T1J8H6_STRMM